MAGDHLPWESCTCPQGHISLQRVLAKCPTRVRRFSPSPHPGETPRLDKYFWVLALAKPEALI